MVGALPITRIAVIALVTALAVTMMVIRLSSGSPGSSTSTVAAAGTSSPGATAHLRHKGRLTTRRPPALGPNAR